MSLTTSQKLSLVVELGNFVQNVKALEGSNDSACGIASGFSVTRQPMCCAIESCKAMTGACPLCHSLDPVGSHRFLLPGLTGCCPQQRLALGPDKSTCICLVVAQQFHVNMHASFFSTTRSMSHLTNGKETLNHSTNESCCSRQKATSREQQQLAQRTC